MGRGHGKNGGAGAEVNSDCKLSGSAAKTAELQRVKQRAERLEEDAGRGG